MDESTLHLSSSSSSSSSSLTSPDRRTYLTFLVRSLCNHQFVLSQLASMFLPEHQQQHHHESTCTPQMECFLNCFHDLSKYLPYLRRPNISSDRVSHAHSHENGNMLRSAVSLFLFLSFPFFSFGFGFGFVFLFSNATTADWMGHEATV